MGCHRTAISREDVVLVLVDIQDRLAAVMDRRVDVIGATRLLVGAADILRIPIIVTRQYPHGLGDTVPEVREALDATTGSADRPATVDKTAFCCVSEPSFSAALAAMGRKSVLLVGMETHICVAQTALALADDGYRVSVAADGCCSRRAFDHEVALARLGTRGVTVTTAEAAIFEAIGEAGTPEFKALLALVR